MHRPQLFRLGVCNTLLQPPKSAFCAAAAPAVHLKEEQVRPPTPKSDRHFLTDTFGRRHTYLRISLTEKCNLRCTYCMPEEGVPLQPASHMLSTDEVVGLSSLFVAHGVNKIRLTGGEPTLRRDLLDIVRRLSALRGCEHVAMTSNGITLHRSLDRLVDAGLSQLNLSLDTLKPHRFEIMTRRPAAGFDKVQRTIRLAQQLLPKVKLNVVVMRGINDDEVNDFVHSTIEQRLDVRFIEYMPFGGNKWNTKRMVPYAEMLRGIEERWPGQIERLSDDPNDTSKAYRIRGAAGQFGFISSMTEHFCGTCNRLRLTADGNLKVCLHGASEVSLRDAIRDPSIGEEELCALIGEAVGRKKKQHAGMLNLSKLPNRPMILIDPIRSSLVNRTTTSTNTYHLPPATYSRLQPFSKFDSLPLLTSRLLSLSQFRPATATATHSAVQQQQQQRQFGTSCRQQQRRQFCTSCRQLSDDGNRSDIEHQRRQFERLRQSLPTVTHETSASVADDDGVDLMEQWPVATDEVTPVKEADSNSAHLTHVDQQTGRARMVDVGAKRASSRLARAEAYLLVPATVADLIQHNHNKKGDAISVAQVAGIQAAKRTADLIPLCHQVPLSSVRLRFDVGLVDDGGQRVDHELSHRVRITAEARCHGQTGVEMEALTGCTVAALTLYDMCKAVAKNMRISDVRLVYKSGGKSGVYDVDN